MLTTEDLEQMSASDKLQLMEDLWESLDRDEIVSPEWHRELLEGRERKIEAGSAVFKDWEDVKASLQGPLT